MADVIHLKLELAEVLFQIDKAIVTEIDIGLPRFDVNGNQLFTYGCQEDSLNLTISPVFDTTGLNRREQRWPGQITLGVKHP